jgi:tetratricopeptide (TPR) repeat protein
MQVWRMRTRWMVLSCSCLITVSCGAKRPTSATNVQANAPQGPSSPQAQRYYDRGIALLKQGAYREAELELTRYLAVNPTCSDAFEYRAAAYLNQDRLGLAVADLSAALRLEPSNARAYGSRGSVYRGLGSLDEAKADFEQCLRLDKTNMLACKGLAAILDSQGRYSEEIAALDRAIQNGPNDTTARVMRGHAYLMLGDFDLALIDYTEAVRLGPSDDAALNGLAWLRATSPVKEVRNGKAAVAAATKACELRGWKSGEWLDTLAAAYAESGDFESAVAYETRAISFGGGSAASRGEMEQRLRLFERRQPYRIPFPGR